VSIVDEIADRFSLGGAGDPHINGVQVGRVINLLDPLLLGRVQVQLPSIDALDLSPWARVATPAAGLASGFYWIPNLGDEVLVAFENGDVNAPYIIGCLWSAIMVPPLPSPLPQIRMIRTPLGNQIMFTEAPPTITISTATLKQTIIMTDAGIQIIAGTDVINMTPDGITLAAPNINLVATTQISIAAPTVNVVGAAATTVGSPASPTAVSGLPVKIN
jgi:phage baseplate assembly protein gpV